MPYQTLLESSRLIHRVIDELRAIDDEDIKKDLEKIVKALMDANYDGEVSLEKVIVRVFRR